MAWPAISSGAAIRNGWLARARFRISGYAVTDFVQNQDLNEAWWAARDSELADGSDMWSRPGIAGHRPLADGGETPRPQGASNPGPPD